ncbi:MAG: hypothetical protein WB689_12335, partial [Xanthobacteraceae bacterium]
KRQVALRHEQNFGDRISGPVTLSRKISVRVSELVGRSRIYSASKFGDFGAEVHGTFLPHESAAQIIAQRLPAGAIQQQDAKII